MAIEVQLVVDTKTGEVQLKKFASKARLSGDKAGKGFKEGFASSFSGIAGAALKTAGVLGTVFAAFATKGAFDAAKSIEKIETQFEVLTGSAGAAKKQIDDLIKFSASTPFQLEGLTDTAASLLSFGVAQDEIIDKIKILGDVAAGSNRPIKEIGLIFGQIKAAGKLTGERLLQLQERAINIGPTLAKNFGVAESAIKGMTSAGKIGFKDVEKALRDMTGAGGIFEDATIKQSKTLGGLVSTLKDNIFALQVALGKAFGPAFKVIITKAISFFQDMTNKFKDNKDSIVNTFFDIAQAIIKFIVAPLELVKNIVANSFNAIAAGVDIVIGKVKESLGFLASALDSFGVGSGLSESLKKVAQEGTEQLLNGFDEFKAIKENLFDFSGATGLDEFIEKLRDTATKVTEPMDKIAKSVSKTLDKVSTKVVGTGKVIAKAINGALVKTASAGIQALTKSLVLGEDGFSNFGGKIAGIIGSMATQLGETLLLTGIGMKALTDLTGGAAIAAGAGLIALGAILSSFSGGSTPSPTGGGVSSGLSAPEDESITDQSDEEERQANQKVQLIVNGDIFDSEETGNRLLSLLNENFENTGGKFTGASFA